MSASCSAWTRDKKQTSESRQRTDHLIWLNSTHRGAQTIDKTRLWVETIRASSQEQTYSLSDLSCTVFSLEKKKRPPGWLRRSLRFFLKGFYIFLHVLTLISFTPSNVLSWTKENRFSFFFFCEGFALQPLKNPWGTQFIKSVCIKGVSVWYRLTAHWLNHYGTWCTLRAENGSLMVHWIIKVPPGTLCDSETLLRASALNL